MSHRTEVCGIWLQLELVQSSLKYFLELRQHSKSDTLEWVRDLTLAC